MEFEINPVTGLIDEPISIVLKNIQPNTSIIIRAFANDSKDRPWSSWVEYKSNKSGVIDISQAIPLSGTYKNIDPLGLFWSMLPVNSKDKTTKFEISDLSSLKINLTAEINNKPSAATTLERVIKKPEVNSSLIHEHDVIGWFYKPNNNPHSKFPAVLLVPGSTGLKPNFATAALLASHGFAVFVMAYINYDDLPNECYEIPLEKVQAAVNWLRAQPNIKPDSIAGMGVSIGTEFLLSAASYIPDINFKAIIANGPSSVVWQGRGRGRPKKISSWSFQGKPLPFLALNENAFLKSFLSSILVRTLKLNKFFPHLIGIKTQPAYLSPLSDHTKVEQARIPIENIKSPLLLISGKDDAMEPTTMMGNAIIEKLKQSNFSYTYKHISYEDVGHVFSLPGTPTTVLNLGLGPIIFACGGKPEATAKANVDFWKNIIDFLNNYLS